MIILAGSAAFIFSVILYSPNDRVVQIGGYGTYHDSDRLWMRLFLLIIIDIIFIIIFDIIKFKIRTWPTQWAASSSPSDGSSRWTATRLFMILI